MKFDENPINDNVTTFSSHAATIHALDRVRVGRGHTTAMACQQPSKKEAVFPLTRSLLKRANTTALQRLVAVTKMVPSTTVSVLSAHSFMQAHSSLQTMRKAHEENDCGFFAFTVIRPPLDWVVSLYDDICHRRLSGHKDSCPQRVSRSR